MVTKSTAPHNPLHIYAGDTLYFLTGAILYRAHLLAPPTYKEHLQE